MADVSESVDTTQTLAAKAEKTKKIIKYVIIVVAAIGVFFLVKKFILKK